MMIAIFLLDWFYYVFFETLWSGRSPGKRALKLRVVGQDGRSLTVLDSVLRNLLRAADFLPAELHLLAAFAIFVLVSFSVLALTVFTFLALFPFLAFLLVAFLAFLTLLFLLLLLLHQQLVLQVDVPPTALSLSTKQTPS